MVSGSSRPKLIAIVGPTASGKSGLALKIAQRFNGEIIAADSRTIYKGLDIGTAKPTRVEQNQVKHYGIDLIEPGERFNAYQFKNYALKKIEDIKKIGKIPILVGGTGLYIDSVLYNFSFIGKKLPLGRRLFFPWWSIEKLQKMIIQRDWPMPENRFNRRHLISTVRRGGQVGTKNTKPQIGAIIVGLMPSSYVLKNRISQRIAKNFNELIAETRVLIKKYGKKTLLRTGGIAYKSATQYLTGEIDESRAKEQIKAAEWRYARRQKTWFKRNKNIKWFNDSNQAFDYLNKLLNT